ncbi:hypothetical protein KX928_12605 [Roseobacter sp. YSTF-M11]|uniref:Uncharacterized protein n=1 Tax=Roseobacter insulae TaxID=2859783 RepID=A0A9X1FX34_9RHOB|nr:HI1506-related protein [Roseobacter insulae]MBW4708625.1 hypothetical protein [Roseobacter insulae]
MAPRKKTTNTKGKEPEQASTEDQRQADTVTQKEAGDTPASAPHNAKDAKPAPEAKTPAPEKATDQDAGPAGSASSGPASDNHSPVQSDAGAAERIAALENQVDALQDAHVALVERHGALLELVEALSNRLETAFEKPGQAVIWDGLGETRDPMPDPLDQPGPDDLEVTVTGPEKGFWRAGRKFDATPVVIPANELTQRQLAALEAEPSLAVKVDVRKAQSTN